eukprot:CAMPEP_0181177084 /NCGR_PEP_ID=MMETSP1096-20121128/4977_1 /TAXON_ID=156174 ORGANISM="Chrysochromulina ericina, Strain CCMP281" /NCGR_SAMPLE_ID=MMETSP1096 /ASSEMBLY_ACC=CAM_ASM_000453 /LENGTH=115 /DNA_ID=CAMNT_0023265221 /DNA_START=1079 /DNA_END=1423 /DNA_ORIENTATION=-
MSMSVFAGPARVSFRFSLIAAFSAFNRAASAARFVFDCCASSIRRRPASSSIILSSVMADTLFILLRISAFFAFSFAAPAFALAFACAASLIRILPACTHFTPDGQEARAIAYAR